MSDWQPGDVLPERSGWYLVAEPASDRPLVLWWSQARPEWRHGVSRVRARAWRGPIVVPREDPLP